MKYVDEFRDGELARGLAAAIAAEVQRQRDDAATTLGIGGDRVFALSARQALTARMQGDEAAVAASGLTQLEDALLNELLPKRSEVIGRMVEDGALALQQHGLARLAERQRQQGEQPEQQTLDDRHGSSPHAARARRPRWMALSRIGRLSPAASTPSAMAMYQTMS